MTDPDTESDITIERTFLVQLPSLETAEVWLNKTELVSLAELSGGKYFELDQLDQLPLAVPDATQRVVVPGTPIPLWDTNRVLILLVLLLGVEWAIRKGQKLL